MLFDIVQDNITLTLVSYEYLVNHRSVKWLMCNFDRTQEQVNKWISRVKDIEVHGTPKPVYKSLVDRTPCGYVNALINCEVDPEDGELGNPFKWDGAGIYYGLPTVHREQFNRLCEPVLIDILYGHMSITGAAAKHHVTPQYIKQLVVANNPIILSGDLCKRKIFYREDMCDMAYINEFGKNIALIFEFLFDYRSQDMSKFTKEHKVPYDEFRDDVHRLLYRCYCAMRNINAVLVTDDDKTVNINGFTTIGIPFTSKWLPKLPTDLV